MLVRALKARVIIELGIIGQPELAPMPQDRLSDGSGVDGRARPRAHQPPVQRDRVEDLHLRAPLDQQPRDDIEQVDLSEGGSHVGQIPAGGRSGTAHPAPGVQSPSALENPINRGQRGDVLAAPPEQLSANGGRPKLSQVTLFPQVAPNRQHPILHFSSHTVGRLPRPSRSVAEIDPIQAQILSSLEPSLNGKQADAEPLRHPAHRSAAANRSHHLATLLLGSAFLFILPSNIGFLLEY